MSFGKELQEFVATFTAGRKMADDWKWRQWQMKYQQKIMDRWDAQDKAKGGGNAAAYNEGRKDYDALHPGAGGGGGGEGGISSDPVAGDLEPHQRAFLNGIAAPESGGAYNVRYGGADGPQHFSSFDEHPGIMVRTPEGKMSSAAGRYQFTKTTWDGLPAKAKGDGKFTPKNQDHAAWFLAQRDYKANGGGDLNADLKEKGFTPEIAKTLSPTWAGFRVAPQKAIAAYDTSLKRYKNPPAKPDAEPAKVADAEPAPSAIDAGENPLGLTPAQLKAQQAHDAEHGAPSYGEDKKVAADTPVEAEAPTPPPRPADLAPVAPTGAAAVPVPEAPVSPVPEAPGPPVRVVPVHPVPVTVEPARPASPATPLTPGKEGAIPTTAGQQVGTATPDPNAQILTNPTQASNAQTLAAAGDGTGNTTTVPSPLEQSALNVSNSEGVSSSLDAQNYDTSSNSTNGIIGANSNWGDALAGTDMAQFDSGGDWGGDSGGGDWGGGFGAFGSFGAAGGLVERVPHADDGGLIDEENGDPSAIPIVGARPSAAIPNGEMPDATMPDGGGPASDPNQIDPRQFQANVTGASNKPPVSPNAPDVSTPLDAGLKFLQDIFHMNGDGGALPSAQQQAGHAAFVAGHGAWTPQEYAAIQQRIDPKKELPASLANAYALNHVYEFNVAKGDIAGARAAAGGLLQFLKERAAHFGNLAVNAKDPATAAFYVAKGYEMVPDGKSVEARMNPDGSGGGVLIQKDAATRAVIAQGKFTPQMLGAAALGLKDGSAFWKSITEAAKDPKEKDKTTAEETAHAARLAYNTPDEAAPAAIPTTPSAPGAAPATPAAPTKVAKAAPAKADDDDEEDKPVGAVAVAAPTKVVAASTDAPGTGTSVKRPANIQDQHPKGSKKWNEFYAMDAKDRALAQKDYERQNKADDDAAEAKAEKENADTGGAFKDPKTRDTLSTQAGEAQEAYNSGLDPEVAKAIPKKLDAWAKTTTMHVLHGNGMDNHESYDVVKQLGQIDLEDPANKPWAQKPIAGGKTQLTLLDGRQITLDQHGMAALKKYREQAFEHTMDQHDATQTKQDAAAARQAKIDAALKIGKEGAAGVGKTIGDALTGPPGRGGRGAPPSYSPPNRGGRGNTWLDPLIQRLPSREELLHSRGGGGGRGRSAPMEDDRPGALPISRYR